MRIVFVLLDSLNRNAMTPYGSEVVHTPNFTRFQERSVTFDNHYVGSLPCMPARRDLHTGRSHFLHRSCAWVTSAVLQAMESFVDGVVPKQD